MNGDRHMTWGYKQVRPKWWVFLVVWLVIVVMGFWKSGFKIEGLLYSALGALILVGIFLLILILNEIIHELWFWVVEKIKSFFKEEGKRP
jgi:hypothetical protein